MSKTEGTHKLGLYGKTSRGSRNSASRFRRGLKLFHVGQGQRQLKLFETIFPSQKKVRKIISDQLEFLALAGWWAIIAGRYQQSPAVLRLKQMPTTSLVTASEIYYTLHLGGTLTMTPPDKLMASPWNEHRGNCRISKQS